MNINQPAATPVVLPFTHARAATDHDPPRSRGVPGLKWMPDHVRALFVRMLGEFIGTFLFLFFAFAGTQVANSSAAAAAGDGPQPSVLLYISLSFGFSLAVNVWTFFRISGGLFNPAVSLGLALIGAVTWLHAIVVSIAQVAGSIAAAVVVQGLLPGDLAVRTTLAPGTSVSQGVFLEMFCTAQLVFTIFMLAAEKHRGTFIAPLGIGLALFICELASVNFTGGSLNPARSIGPNIVTGKFDGSHWIYWVGPFLGALVAVIFYRLVKMLEYETANPGADADAPPRAPGGNVNGQVDGTADGWRDVVEQRRNWPGLNTTSKLSQRTSQDRSQRVSTSASFDQAGSLEEAKDDKKTSSG